MIKENIKTAKEILDKGGSLTAELFDTGQFDENQPVQEWRAVVNGDGIKIVLNMVDMIKIVELYRRK